MVTNRAAQWAGLLLDLGLAWVLFRFFRLNCEMEMVCLGLVLGRSWIGFWVGLEQDPPSHLLSKLPEIFQLKKVHQNGVSTDAPPRARSREPRLLLRVDKTPHPTPARAQMMLA